MNTCVPELSEEIIDEIEQDAKEWALSKGKNIAMRACNSYRFNEHFCFFFSVPHHHHHHHRSC